jgi:glucose-6-phosphate-specific signal transduction histidine kinase
MRKVRPYRCFNVPAVDRVLTLGGEPLVMGVVIGVRDDGRGGADFARGSGLVGLKDRVEALGGRLGMQTAPGAGTTVHAELPLGPRG